MTDTKETQKNRRGFIKAAKCGDRCQRNRFPFISRAQDKPIRIGICRPFCPGA